MRRTKVFCVFATVPIHMMRKGNILMKQAKAITGNMLEQHGKNFHKNPLLVAMGHALSKNPLANVAFVQSARPQTQFCFSIDLQTLPVTNQKKSGRCWIFSGLNLLRERIAKKYNLEQFELSQNYTAFWDKFEKINYFLESIIDLRDRPADDRELTHILMTGVQDGGQWDMFVSLVEKYGVVPKAAMDETVQSSETATMNAVLRQGLTRCAASLRRMHAEGKDLCALQAEKERMLDSFYGMLCACFGEPPRSFDFEYVDKDKNYGAVRGLTPQQFYREHVGADLGEYASIIHAPTADKPFGRTYTVDYLGNVVGGRPIRYLNVPMQTLKAAVIAQLQAGESVWFGSDAGKFGDSEDGIWDDNAYDYAGAFAMDLSVSKEEGLDLRWSAMNHAMTITGVNLDETGAPTKWKIQNSWSDERGIKGYFVMSDSWFDRFVYQAVVRSHYLPAAEQEQLKAEPIHLHPWDPMGTLAD